MIEISREVGYSSTGTDGKLSLKAAADFLQDCSLHHLKCQEKLNKFFVQNNVGMYMVSRQMDILRLPVYGEKLTVRTWVYECKSMYGFRNTVIYDGENKPCVVTNSSGAFMNLETARPIRVSEELINSIDMEPQFPMEYLPRKIAQPAAYDRTGTPFPVLRSHLDMNFHMNNANYLVMAEEYLPEGFSPKRIRVEYKIPAKLGDMITPLVAEEENSVTVNLSSAEGKPFAVVEFTR